MDNPERHLREFLADYFYGEGSGDPEVAKEATEDCITFMRDRGWEFEMIPIEERQHPMALNAGVRG